MLRAAFWAGLVALLVAPPASAADKRILAVDADDDDADGVPDRAESEPPSAPEIFVLTARPPSNAPAFWVAPASALVRVVADGKVIPAGARIPTTSRTIALQATKPGVGTIAILGKTWEISAVEVLLRDGLGAEVDVARGHASFERVVPARLPDDPLAADGDPDALRYIVAGAVDDIPTTLDLRSIDERGASVDAIEGAPLTHVPCPPRFSADVVCGATPPIRIVSDDIDRNFPLVRDRSLKAALGGAIVVRSPEGAKLAAVRVGGPRRGLASAAPRYRARARWVLVRSRPQGPPPVGPDDAAAIGIARVEIARANALWSACGISFGAPEEVPIAIVDPPRAHLVAIGCDRGLPASGGSVRIRVDGQEIVAEIEREATPVAAARAVAASVRAIGLTATVSENAPTNASAHPSADVLVRRRGGALAQVDPPASGAMSSDATLSVCIGDVDLDDGLDHFGDTDAYAGTLEERTILKAFDDVDPETIDLLLVPGFAEGGRIGESFIFADRSAVRNAVIEDRAAVRADRASFALAHEIGHVLLDEPGHPDDFGADTPSSLMDGDATSPSAFGPRRISIEECDRAVRQSGPDAPVKMLKPWPFAPMVWK